MNTETYAVDFETYYDKDISVTIQGAVNYSHLADAYCVSIYGPGVEYAGSLEAAPWERISGNHWVSHNAGFDSAVFSAAIEKGQIPALPSDLDNFEFYPEPDGWDCTADLSAYFGLGRSLKDALKSKYGIVLSKTVRDSAKGKKWPEDFPEADREAMLKYALEDARHCWNLWNDLGAYWPEDQVQLSRITRQRCREGVCVDRTWIVIAQAYLTGVMESAKNQIPWRNESDVIMSHKKVKDYCVTAGIPAPESLAENDEACAAWEKEHGDKHSLVGAIRKFRKANLLDKKITSIVNRIMPNGRMNFTLKYFGAHTGRFSGADGLNMQNLPREAEFGVGLRGLFIPAPGKKFVICDLAQIEPRCSAYVCRDTAMLKAMEDGHGIYEAFARSTGAYEGVGKLKETDKELYLMSKAQVLALGYGCGAEKFVKMARIYAGLEIDEAQSKETVDDFRARSPLVIGMWKRLNQEMYRACCKREIYEIQLLSGRWLRYTNLRYAGGLLAIQGYSGNPRRYWGGKIFENVIQATAFDVLAAGILRLEAAGIPVIFSAHDEVVCEVDKSVEGALIKQLMTIPPSWAPDLPLEAEYVETDRYQK